MNYYQLPSNDTNSNIIKCTCPKHPIIDDHFWCLVLILVIIITLHEQVHGIDSCVILFSCWLFVSYACVKHGEKINDS